MQDSFSRATRSHLRGRDCQPASPCPLGRELCGKHGISGRNCIDLFRNKAVHATEHRILFVDDGRHLFGKGTKQCGQCRIAAKADHCRQFRLDPGSAADRSSTLFEPALLGPLTLRNRIIKAATFEGMTPDGVVTEDLIGFHRSVAAGGTAMTTRRVPVDRTRGSHRLRVHPPGAGARDGLRRLTAAIHDEGTLRSSADRPCRAG